MTGKTPQFFTVQPVQAALDSLFAANPLAPVTETIPTVAALGRVLAAEPHSPMNLPDFVRSTMDGYAVRAQDTFGASDALPAYLTCVGHVHMGEVPAMQLQSGQTVEIHTGAMLPPGADAVVMVEKTQQINADEVEILSGVAPGENLVQVGEDVGQGDAILPRGHRLRPQDIGGLLAVGITEVTVARPPTVALMGSGDELVSPDQTPQLGQVRDINSYTLATLFQSVGANTQVLGIAQDTPESLYALAKQGYDDADMLVMTAGSSVSVRDLTRETIQKLGTPGIIQHGLAVKPGKPTILAACDGKPVIGLPGNPVSAFLVACQVVLPILQHMMGETITIPKRLRATLTSNIASKSGREDTVPVRLQRNDDATWQAEPIFGKSNLIFTLIKADGLVTVPLNVGGLKAGASVEVMLL